MATGDDVIDSRLANALFTDASASPEALAAVGRVVADANVILQPGTYVAPLAPRIFARLINSELDWFKRRQGGLWVGGKAVLSSEVLRFIANSMNQALHSAPDQLNWSVSLAEIADVRVRRGIITNIIDVQTPQGALSFRCFRAKAFAFEIDRARVTLRY